MNIEKYGWTENYGYGCIRDASAYLIFEPRILVSAKTKVSNRIIGKKIGAAGVEDNPKPSENAYTKAYNEISGGSFERILSLGFSNKTDDLGMGIYLRNRKDTMNRNGRQKMYLVFDGDTKNWREYFTGEIMNVVTPQLVNTGQQIFIKGILIDAENKDIIGVKTLSIGTPQICDAISFYDDIKQFSDEEIREMVRQMDVLRRDAQSWGSSFERAIREVREESSRADSVIHDVESEIAAGFGKYKERGNDNVPVGDQVKNNDRSVVPNEIRRLWIKQGKCAYCGGTLVTDYSRRNTRVCRNCKRLYSGNTIC